MTRTPPGLERGPRLPRGQRSWTTGKSLLIRRIPGLEQVVVQRDVADAAIAASVSAYAEQHALGLGTVRACTR
jgi:hypothetical protein